MNAAILILFVLLCCYSGVLLWLASGFLRTPYFFSGEKNTQLPLTIIICARNEEKHISLCLRSLLKQKYTLSKVQLILINDASSDATAIRAEQILKNSELPYKIISNQGQKGKKQSITYAMQFAHNDLIVLRDADTFTLSDLWLQSISGFYQDTKADLIIAPVAIANYKGFFWSLQAIENNVLTVASCGSAFYHNPFLCSGANLIFTKKTFEKTNGYAAHINIPSGDDIFFMEDVKKINGSKIAYLKSKQALVYTYPVFSLQQLILQKTRWASKFKHNKNKLNLILSFLTFATNLACIFCLAGVTIQALKSYAVLFILLKLFIDILLLFLASDFIKNKNILWFSIPVAFIYPMYAGVVGVASLFVKPRWK